MMTRFAALGLTASVVSASASAAPVGAPPGPSLITQLLFFLPLILIFYFLLIRPQSQRAKKHAQMVSDIQKGDTVITSGGLVGKVHKVADEELTVDMGENVRVKLIRNMVIEVRSKNAPVAAND